MESTYLMHHGTKGMKWGIRRYQNPDGTLTDAGKSRYGYGEKKGSSSYERKHARAYNELRSDYDKKRKKFNRINNKLVKDMYKKNPGSMEFENPPDKKLADRHKKAWESITKDEKNMSKTLKELGMNKKEIAYREAGYEYAKELRGNLAARSLAGALGGAAGVAVYTAYRSGTYSGKMRAKQYEMAKKNYNG